DSVLDTVGLELAGFLFCLTCDAKSSDGARLEASDRNHFSALLAFPERSVVDPAERLLDLVDQLAFPVPDPQVSRRVAFPGRAVGRIGECLGNVAHPRDRLAGIFHELRPLRVKQPAEHLELLGSERGSEHRFRIRYRTPLGVAERGMVASHPSGASELPDGQ